MSLENLCKKISKLSKNDLNINHKTNLITQEYSKTSKEKKEYTFSDNPIFSLIWRFDNNVLYSTLLSESSNITTTANFISGQKTQLHTHEYLELGYVLKGEFKQIILSKTINFSKGDICLIDKNCIHQDILIDSDAIIIFLGFKNDIFQEIINTNISNHNLNTFLNAAILNKKKVKEYIHFKPHINDKNVQNIINKILSEELEYNVGSSYIIKGLLLRLFGELSINYEYTLTRDQRSNMNNFIFDEIISMMEMNYKNITLQDLINTFHYNADYYNRLIKAMTGMTYSSLLQSIRLEKAIFLLINTDKKIDDIAEEIGYNNKGYFYKIFQDKYGITPYNYRKNSKEKNRYKHI